MNACEIDASAPLRGENLVGRKFGRLTVIEFAGVWRRPYTTTKVWLCKCDCGGSKFGAQLPLFHGKTVSCGCYRREHTAAVHTTHGLTTGKRHPIHAIWKAMVRRCENPKDRAWKWYGGSGITVCDRWRNSFVDFVADMLPSWKPELWLERKDNKKGYCPDNAIWDTIENQANNKRDTRRFEHTGAFLTALELSRLSGIPKNTIYNRIHQLGWSVERAIKTPLIKRKS